MLPSIESKLGRYPVNAISNPPRRRGFAIGYAMGTIVASLIYVGWDAFVVTRSEPGGLRFRLFFVLFFWVAGGFAPTLLVMIVPWSLAVSACRKLRWSAQLYFPTVGAFMVFALGCASASLAPKPFFIEDQTFLQGVAIAADRQGVSFLLAGLAFGACYWFFGERQVSAQEQRQSDVIP